MFSNIILVVYENKQMMQHSNYSIFKVVIYSPFSILFEDIKDKKRHWAHIKDFNIIKQY